MKKNYIKTLAVFAFGVVVTLVFTYGRDPGPNERLFQDVLTLVSRKYVNPISNDSLLLTASRGLIDDLGDPYAHLYTANELTEYTQTHLGHYGGVGMIVTERDGKGEVQHVYPKTPAGDAGLNSGDIIVNIDNQEIDNWPLEKITGHLRGEVGTKVHVTVLHEGTRTSYDLTRAEIHIPAVGYDLKFNKTGYIPLTTFNETSAEEVKKALDDVRSSGATSLVLDLRGNGGGLVDQAVAIADLFLKQNMLVLSQRERDDTINYKTEDAYDADGLPLVVLVDRFTASASEILAGALQDYKRATIIGERTYGKGVVQTAFPASNGAVVKITTGKWYTPLGRTIQKPQGTDSLQIGGVHPDIAVPTDTFTTIESSFLKGLGAKRADFYIAVSDVAHEVARSGQGDVQIGDAQLNEVFTKATARGVVMTRADYDKVRDYIHYVLMLQATDYRNGEAAAKRVTLERDRVLQRALDVVQRSAARG